MRVDGVSLAPDRKLEGGTIAAWGFKTCIKFTDVCAGCICVLTTVACRPNGYRWWSYLHLSVGVALLCQRYGTEIYVLPSHTTKGLCALDQTPHSIMASREQP